MPTSSQALILTHAENSKFNAHLKCRLPSCAPFPVSTVTFSGEPLERCRALLSRYEKHRRADSLNTGIFQREFEAYDSGGSRGVLSFDNQMGTFRWQLYDDGAVQDRILSNPRLDFKKYSSPNNQSDAVCGRITENVVGLKTDLRVSMSPTEKVFQVARDQTTVKFMSEEEIIDSLRKTSSRVNAPVLTQQKKSLSENDVRTNVRRLLDLGFRIASLKGMDGILPVQKTNDGSGSIDISDSSVPSHLASVHQKTVKRVVNLAKKNLDSGALLTSNLALSSKKRDKMTKRGKLPKGGANQGVSQSETSLQPSTFARTRLSPLPVQNKLVINMDEAIRKVKTVDPTKFPSIDTNRLVALKAKILNDEEWKVTEGNNKLGSSNLHLNLEELLLLSTIESLPVEAPQALLETKSKGKFKPPTIRMRKELPPSDRTQLCFSLRNSNLSHQEVKNILESHTSSKIASLVFDPVYMHLDAEMAGDNINQTIWVFRLEDKNQIPCMLSKGLEIENQFLRIRYYDDVLKEEHVAYKMLKEVEDEKLRKSLTKNKKKKNIKLSSAEKQKLLKLKRTTESSSGISSESNSESVSTFFHASAVPC